MVKEIKGKGQYWEIKPGVYQYRFSLGKNPNGKGYLYSAKRTLHCISKNKRGREAELRTAMENYKQELNGGIVGTRRTPQTVYQYAKQFHENREATFKSPLSAKREALEVEHIGELFNQIKLEDLRPYDIKEAYNQARKNERFSESELKKTHTRLKQIMKEAIRDGYITTNPCDGVESPKPDSVERRSFTQEEATRFVNLLAAEKLDAHIVATYLLLQTGMRRSEVTGIIWDNYDEKTGLLTIHKQYAADLKRRSTKSEAGRRSLYLNNEAQKLLNHWKTVQKEALAAVKLEQTQDTPVVHVLKKSNVKREDGQVIKVIDVGFMNPNNYSRWFRNFSVDNGFGEYTKDVRTSNYLGKKVTRGSGYIGIYPHMLRHTQATFLIGAGADIKTVQNRLGHSDPSLTLRTYSHAIPANDKAAAEVFNALLTNAHTSETQPVS